MIKTLLLSFIVLFLSMTEAIQSNDLKDGKIKGKSQKELSQRELRAKEKLGQQKLHQMEQLEEKSTIGDGIILMEDANSYRKLVLQTESRPYDVIVLFNLMPAEAEERCHHCIGAEKGFHLSAFSYAPERFKKAEEKSKPRKIFFVLFRLDINNKDLIDIFSNEHNKATIPWLSISAERDPNDRHHRDSFFDAEWEILDSADYSGKKQIEFINEGLNPKMNVQMRLTLKEHMTANCIIVGMMAGALAALYFGYPVLIWQPLWVMIAFVVWFFSTGGIVFCNTEKPAKYRSHWDNELGQMVVDEYIMRVHNQQYGYEGYLYSGLVLGIGICLIIAVNVHKYIHNGIVVRIIMSGMFVAIYVLQEYLKQMAQSKVTWNPSIKPSGHLYKGGLLENQGFNIL